jgi:D-proline reductase (dithiol) PrdB
VGLVARIAEGQGIATVCVMNLRKVAERILAPRTLLVDRPFGAVLGEPGDREGQRARVTAALAMLEDRNVRPGEIRVYRS